jgi:transposase
VRFKGKNLLSSLEGKSNCAGIRWKDETLNWSGLKLKPLINKYDPVIIHGELQRVKYCRIVRRVIKGKNRFYVQLVNEGLPFSKPQNTIGTETIGIDVGTSTVAIVGETSAKLCQFCEELNVSQKQIRKLQRKIDRQRRGLNPKNYDEKGRVKKGAKNWQKSQRQKRTEYQLSNIQRKTAAHRKSLHGQLVNEVLRIGNKIKLEKVSYKGWQRRYGKSIGLRAPSMFVSCLLRKAESAAGETLIFSTAKTALSQTCQCGCKAKKSLSKRVHKCACGVVSQRDLYSAFLARFVDKETELLQAELARNSWSEGAELLLRRAWQQAVNNSRVDGRVLSFFGVPQESERVVSKVLKKSTKMSDGVADCESRQE